MLTDLVKYHYHRRHGRALSAGKASEITSNFIQVREYFRNSGNSDFSVRPLLQFYGVEALASGLILFLDSDSRQTPLKLGNGLHPVGWQDSAAGGLHNLGSLTIRISPELS
jgi:hypothetical protein